MKNIRKQEETCMTMTGAVKITSHLMIYINIYVIKQLRDTCVCANMYVCFPGRVWKKKNLIVMKTHITVSIHYSTPGI